jgi:hypothetical protein
MLPKIAVIGLMLLATAACAPMPRPAPSIPPAAGPEANAASADAKSADAGKPGDLLEPDMQAMPPTDVRTMKCSVINSAGDDDKAYASTFLLGYRSALMHMHVIDTKRIDSILQAAIAECVGQPETLASKVFAGAEMKAYAADQPAARRLLRRRDTRGGRAGSTGAPAYCGGAVAGIVAAALCSVRGRTAAGRFLTGIGRFTLAKLTERGHTQIGK